MPFDLIISTPIAPDQKSVAQRDRGAPVVPITWRREPRCARRLSQGFDEAYFVTLRSGTAPSRYLGSSDGENWSPV